MAEPYLEPFDEVEKKFLKAGQCPKCGLPLYDKAGNVYCEAGIEDEEGCDFWTSQAFLKYQIGVNPFAFTIKPPKSRN